MASLRFLVAALAFLVCMLAAPPQPAAAARADAGDVVAFARAQIGKPYRWGATGLRRYDCSGLVYRAFRANGLLTRIGGSRKTAHGYFRWFRNRGLVTRSPKKGDLVVWGGRRAVHIGIFRGYDRRGRPIAISALRGGVAQHRVRAINVRLKGYLRVRMNR